MRKHNRKFATRFGSASVDSGVPKMAHYITNNTKFQFMANGMLQRLFKVK